MSFWPYLSAAAAAGIALLGGHHLKKRTRRLELADQRARKLEELAQAGVIFSRSYDLGSATLIIDEKAMRWVLIEHDRPAQATPRPFSAIESCHSMRSCKLHAGVRRYNAAAMLRSGTGENNREFYQTDTSRGLEIHLKPPEENTYLYIDCMESDLSPAWLETILNSLGERESAL